MNVTERKNTNVLQSHLNRPLQQRAFPYLQETIIQTCPDNIFLLSNSSHLLPKGEKGNPQGDAYATFACSNCVDPCYCFCWSDELMYFWLERDMSQTLDEAIFLFSP